MACDCPLGTIHRCGQPTAADKLRRAAKEALEAYERYLKTVR